jgi:hypothetical protein
MAPAKAQESVALRITLVPHEFSGRHSDLRHSRKTPLDRASLSVTKPEMPLAMSEQLEKPQKFPPFSRALQLSCLSFTQRQKFSAWSSGSLRAGGH